MTGSVCFVGGGIGTLLGRPDGGSERQIALIASELAARGNRVSLVVPGLREECRIEGITVIPGWTGGSGWPKGARFFTSRLPQLKRAIAGTEPDLLYTRGFSLFAPAVASVSRRTGAAYLAALACDDDLRSRARSRPLGIIQRAGYGYAARAFFIRHALRKADLVLSQHRGQAVECERMGIASRVVRNVFLPPAGVPVTGKVFDAAWVGHVSEFKGFDRLLDILRLTSGLRVAVAGSVQGKRNGRLLHAAASVRGLEYLGELPHRQVLELVSSSGVLLNTSPAEGFPNTFLEAWYLERPVVSLVSDPDGLLSGEGSLGFCGTGSVRATAGALMELCRDPGSRLAMGARGKLHVERYHMVGTVVDSLEAAWASAGDLSKDPARHSHPVAGQA